MILNGELAQQINSFLTFLVEYVEQFGFIGAMLMAFLEAIFPSLPLVAIAGVNITNYGVLGFFFTYIGSIVGMVLIFYIIRYFLTERFQNSKFLGRHKGVNRFLSWVEKKGFTSVMILMCFPFIPTSLLNYACALSKMPKKEYIIIVLISRFVSIAFLSYVGSSLLDFINHPTKGIVALIVMFLVYGLSKVIEKRVDVE